MNERGLFRDALTNKIARFLNEIGIPTTPAEFDRDTFLPGILVSAGALLVDEKKLAFPGDLLHEAGHLAVAPADLRSRLSDEIVLPGVNPDDLEMQAIAWSYAACVHLQLDPRIVFHESGYKGKSEGILFNFSHGIFFGLNGLEESGMTFSEARAERLGGVPFPAMRKWLRD